MSTYCDTCLPYKPPRSFCLFLEKGIRFGVKCVDEAPFTFVESSRDPYKPLMEPLPVLDLSLVPAACPVLQLPTPHATIHPAMQFLAHPNTLGPLKGIVFRCRTANVEKQVNAIANLFGPCELDQPPILKHVVRTKAVLQLVSAFWGSFVFNPYPPGHTQYVHWSVCRIRNIFPDVCIRVTDICELFELFRLAADVRDAMVGSPCVDARESLDALQRIWDRCVYQTPCRCPCTCSCLHPLTYVVYV